MTKHQKNNKNKKPKARASSAPYAKVIICITCPIGATTTAATAAGGRSGGKEQPPKAPAGSVAEAEKKVAHFNEFVLQNMANKATAEENIKFGVRKLADWTERLQARSSAPQGQSAVDEALAKEMAEREAEKAKKEKEKEENEQFLFLQEPCLS
ncbi:hypothetical protein FPOAC1_009697 [Fusarium poae]|uniref:hypothetical protein n=1 Tax=Fusarium poae TaxID=36050 RepID=UPI001CE7234A|nr:hypothetical protein FPOAC1_009697 [Fusarium poae]KAG8670289.1 hypothetical protein FPOAC1_009697 [Fusarium poae]